jgi:hypothetical protein
VININLMLRRLPLEYLGVNSTAVSKHGHEHLACCPSFETHPCGALLRMR